jgi:regulator of sigma E protease
MENILYLFLAILGLGFLVFIHELGHYVMARRVGMTARGFFDWFWKSDL